MNIKRILAAASASVVAVSAMAVTSITSFAETKELSQTFEAVRDNWNATSFDSMELIDGIDMEKYQVTSVDFECDMPFILAYSSTDESINWWSQASSPDTSYSVTDMNLDDTYGPVQYQIVTNIWTEAVKDEDGNETGERLDTIEDGNDWKPYEGHYGETYTVKITVNYEAKPDDGGDTSDDTSSDTTSSDTTSSNTTSTPATDKAPTSLKDDGSKIETSFKEGVFAAGTKIAVKEDKAQSGTDKVAFDISFSDKDGKEVQPNGEVSVSIPVPAAFKDAKTLFVFHVEKDGKYTEVKSEVKDGKITFTAKAFSTFVISTKDLNAPAASTDSTPKIKPADQQNVPAIGEGPADQRPVPSIGYKDGTTNNGGNGGNSGNSGDNSGSDNKPADPSNPSNPNTGVAIAFAPALLAGAAVVVAKKRK